MAEETNAGASGAAQASEGSTASETPIRVVSYVGEKVSDEPPVRAEPYNADRSRDATRQTITLWLIGLLCAIVSLTFVALFARGAASGFADKDFFQELKQVLDVLVGPIITLLASAIGFYFGYKQGELGEQVKSSKERV